MWLVKILEYRLHTLYQFASLNTLSDNCMKDILEMNQINAQIILL